MTSDRKSKLIRACAQEAVTLARDRILKSLDAHGLMRHDVVREIESVLAEAASRAGAWAVNASNADTRVVTNHRQITGSTPLPFDRSSTSTMDALPHQNAVLSVHSTDAHPARPHQRPVRAWMRRWYFDGRVPHKQRNENGRMVWPTEFKFMPVTPDKVMADDVPLYAADDSHEST